MIAASGIGDIIPRIGGYIDLFLYNHLYRIKHDSAS